MVKLGWKGTFKALPVGAIFRVKESYDGSGKVGETRGHTLCKVSPGFATNKDGREYLIAMDAIVKRLSTTKRLRRTRRPRRRR